MAKGLRAGRRPADRTEKSARYADGRLARASRRGGSGTGACQTGCMSEAVSEPLPAPETGTTLAAVVPELLPALPLKGRAKEKGARLFPKED